MDVFLGGPTKDKIRRELDKSLIKKISKNGKERLPYLGLAGPLMLDIIEWQDYLSDFTVVERSYAGKKLTSQERAIHELCMRTALTTELQGGRGVIHDYLDVIHGDIDKDIILQGKGDFGKTLGSKWYGLINLDYYGGIFKARDREDAVKKLITDEVANCSSDCDYVLLLTVENLDRGKTEKQLLVDEILQNLEKARIEVSSLEQLKSFLITCSYGLLQKIYVPIKIYLFARSCGSELHCEQPTIYHEESMKGEKHAGMLHFRFVVSIKKQQKDAPQKIKDIVEICNLDLLTVNESGITQHPTQTPKLLFNGDEIE